MHPEFPNRQEYYINNFREMEIQFAQTAEKMYFCFARNFKIWVCNGHAISCPHYKIYHQNEQDFYRSN